MDIVRKAAALAAGVLLGLGSVAAGQEAQRIQFEKGKSSAVLKGTVVVKDGEASSSQYLLRASAGQTLTVRFTAGDPEAAYTVTCPGNGGTGSGASPWSFDLPESGDYRIAVSGYSAEKTFPYTLEVGVEGTPHPVAPQGATGTWSLEMDPDNQIEVRQLPGNRILFHVSAFWKGANWEQYGPNLGNLTGTADLRNGKAVYDHPDQDCKLVLQFSGDRLKVDQDGTCDFGHNVTAAGAYKRTSLCAAPERFEEGEP